MKKTFSRKPRLLLTGSILFSALAGVVPAQAQSLLNVPSALNGYGVGVAPATMATLSAPPAVPAVSSDRGTTILLAAADTGMAADAVPAGAAPTAVPPTTRTSPEVSGERRVNQIQNGTDSAAARTASAQALSHMAAGGPTVPVSSCIWPTYSRFLASNVQADGRVIDYTPPVQTTSEGQSYALFFALVNNDRDTFDRVLNWTIANLAGGDLTARLPAWRWGGKPDGSYGVLDPNSASDADLWIAYDLAQAGRLWHESRFSAMARAMLSNIARREVFDLPGLGPMLAPGQVGFALAADVWRLNPSYTPLPLLRVAAMYDTTGPWRKMAANTATMMQAVSPHGFAPDWVAYQTGKGFIIDPQKGATGSYDAIRTYLWAGMTSRADPLARPVLAALNGMQSRVAQNGAVPEKVDTLSGISSGVAPQGFLAALLPYLRAGGMAGAGSAGSDAANGATGANALYNAMRGRVAELSERPSLGYYNAVLTLFGQGFADSRYQFDSRGQLQPNWSNSCRAGTR